MSIPQNLAVKLFQTKKEDTEDKNFVEFTNNYFQTEEKCSETNELIQACISTFLRPKASEQYNFLIALNNMFIQNSSLFYMNKEDKKREVNLLSTIFLLLQIHIQHDKKVPETWQLLGYALKKNETQLITYYLLQALMNEELFTPERKMAFFNIKPKTSLELLRYWKVTKEDYQKIHSEEGETTLLLQSKYNEDKENINKNPNSVDDLINEEKFINNDIFTQCKNKKETKESKEKYQQELLRIKQELEKKRNNRT